MHSPRYVPWGAWVLGDTGGMTHFLSMGLSEKASMMNLARIRHSDRVGDKCDQESTMGSRERWSHLDG